MTRALLVALFALLLLASGFVAGRMSAGPEDLAEGLRIDPRFLFTDDRIVDGGDMRTYANYRAALAEGRIPDAEIAAASDLSRAELLPAFDAVALKGQFPAAANALYALYRSLEFHARADPQTAEARRSVVFSLNLAEGAKYLAVMDGDPRAYGVADKVQDCVLGAIADETPDVLVNTCVPDLAAELEAILGFRPAAGARERGDWVPPGTPGG